VTRKGWEEKRIENSMASPDGLASQVAALASQLEEQKKSEYQFREDVTSSWLVICGSLVFFMQTGFAMIETGVVSKLNVVSVMFKNLLDSCIAGITFWLVGYAFAYGEDWNGFIGTTNFALANGGVSASWFYQWTFAGASATIVSGAVCERIRIKSYIAFTTWMCIVIYPVVAHWIWGGGFLSHNPGKQHQDGSYDTLFGSHGVLDFAGSGVVHLVGGVAACTGAFFLKPRMGRFHPETGEVRELEGHNKTLMVLGTGVLVFGWYGFNCGSVGSLYNNGHVIATVAVNTTVALSSGGCAGILVALFSNGRFELQTVLNCILAGLVSINASADFLPQWATCIIAATGALVYYAFRCLLLRLRIDDPLEASAVHGAAGAWGLLAAGIFCTDSGVRPEVVLGEVPHVRADACSSGAQFGAQVVAVACIMAWTGVMSTLAWGALQGFGVLRVPYEWEEIGMDNLEHGAEAFPTREPQLGLMLEAGGADHGAQLYVNEQYLTDKKGVSYGQRMVPHPATMPGSRDPSGRFLGAGVQSNSGSIDVLRVHLPLGADDRSQVAMAQPHLVPWGYSVQAPVHMTLEPAPTKMDGYFLGQGMV